MKSENRYKELYDCLLSSKELGRLHTGLKGSWDLDKEKFTEQQKELERIVNYIDVDEE